MASSGAALSSCCTECRTWKRRYTEELAENRSTKRRLETDLLSSVQLCEQQQARLELVSSEAASLRQGKAKAENEAKSMKVQLQMQQAEAERLLNERVAFETEARALAATSAALQQQLSESRGSSATVEGELASVKVEMAALHSRYLSAVEEKHRLEDAAEALRASLEAKQDELYQAADHAEALRSEALSQAELAIRAREESIQALETELSTLGAALQVSRQDRLAIEAQATQLKEDCLRLQAENERLEEQCVKRSEENLHWRRFCCGDASDDPEGETAETAEARSSTVQALADSDRGVLPLLLRVATEVGLALPSSVLSSSPLSLSPASFSSACTRIVSDLLLHLSSQRASQSKLAETARSLYTAIAALKEMTAATKEEMLATLGSSSSQALGAVATQTREATEQVAQKKADSALASLATAHEKRIHSLKQTQKGERQRLQQQLSESREETLKTRKEFEALRESFEREQRANVELTQDNGRLRSLTVSQADALSQSSALLASLRSSLARTKEDLSASIAAASKDFTRTSSSLQQEFYRYRYQTSSKMVLLEAALGKANEDKVELQQRAAALKGALDKTVDLSEADKDNYAAEAKRLRKDADEQLKEAQEEWRKERTTLEARISALEAEAESSAAALAEVKAECNDALCRAVADAQAMAVELQDALLAESKAANQLRLRLAAIEAQNGKLNRELAASKVALQEAEEELTTAQAALAEHAKQATSLALGADERQRLKDDELIALKDRLEHERRSFQAALEVQNSARRQEEADLKAKVEALLRALASRGGRSPASSTSLHEQRLADPDGPDAESGGEDASLSSLFERLTQELHALLSSASPPEWSAATTTMLAAAAQLPLPTTEGASLSLHTVAEPSPIAEELSAAHKQQLPIAAAANKTGPTMQGLPSSALVLADLALQAAKAKLQQKQQREPRQQRQRDEGCASTSIPAPSSFSTAVISSGAGAVVGEKVDGALEVTPEPAPSVPSAADGEEAVLLADWSVGEDEEGASGESSPIANDLSSPIVSMSTPSLSVPAAVTSVAGQQQLSFARTPVSRRPVSVSLPTSAAAPPPPTSAQLLAAGAAKTAGSTPTSGLAKRNLVVDAAPPSQTKQGNKNGSDEHEVFDPLFTLSPATPFNKHARDSAAPEAPGSAAPAVAGAAGSGAMPATLASAAKKAQPQQQQQATAKKGKRSDLGRAAASEEATPAPLQLENEV